MIDTSVLPESNEIPPVHTWKPTFCGDMDLVIKSNGDWIHEGSPIKRPALVKLFSHILWLEKGEHYLVTPVEKVRIQVEDAPFLVIAWRWITTEQGPTIEFQTLTDDILHLGINADIWIDHFGNEERPYLSMRYGMKALINRSVFYDLAQHLIPIETKDDSGMGLISAGKTYLLMKSESS